MQQGFYSIFWFAAENVDSLQDWYNRASFCIAPGRFRELSRDHHRAVTQWLLDPANGKWILIFDNANPELNFGDILPENVPWGKTLFTSCTEDIRMGTKRLTSPYIAVPMPPLSIDEALTLFMSRCGNLGLTQAQKSEITRLTTSLRHNPLAITLASLHFQTFQTMSDRGGACDEFSERDGHHIRRFTSLLIEDARMSQRILIEFLVLLSRNAFSSDIIDACQRSRRRLRDLQTAADFLRTSNTGPAIQHWVSIGLLQRQTSPSRLYFVIPSFVKTTILQELANDPEQAESILKLGLILVSSVQDEIFPSSMESMAECIEKTIVSFRNLCMTAKDMSVTVPEDIGKYLQLAALHYLDKVIEEGRRLFNKLFWRQWLASFQYPLPSYTINEEKSLVGPPNFPWPMWLETGPQSNEDPESLDSKTVIQNALIARLWDQLNLAILASGMGRGWHGVREYVFDFARRKFHSGFSEEQKARFIDYVDKGGAEGLQAVLLTVTNAGEFQQEATNRINSDAVDDIVQMICAISSPYIISLSEEAVQQAISEALDHTMSDMFMQACGAMDEVLLPIQDLINSIMLGSLEVPSDGEGARTLVRFAVGTTGEKHIRQRCLAMTEGFCGYLDSAKVWIASKVCLHLTYNALQESGSMGEIDWNRVYAIIELIREGVMPVEKVPGRMGEVAGRRMVYWLEEACKCRSAWGAQPGVPGYKFRNQVLWEDTCILMGAASGSWIVS
jgi:hypothetical protein